MSARSDKPETGPPADPAAAPINVPMNSGGSLFGSRSKSFQTELLHQAISALWSPKWKSADEQRQAAVAAIDALKAIAPTSELEAMLAVQMISTHNAAMECLRRSMLEDQSFEGRDQNLKHAAKLMALYQQQLAALDKHQGRGQQKITVEHVTVEAGGQAIVGNVQAPVAGTNAGRSEPMLTDKSGTVVPLAEPLTRALRPAKVLRLSGERAKR